MMKDDGTLDLWSGSRFKVFQKLTDNANAAMLHFFAPTHPELSVRSFLVRSAYDFNFLKCKKLSKNVFNEMLFLYRRGYILTSICLITLARNAHSI